MPSAGFELALLAIKRQQPFAFQNKPPGLKGLLKLQVTRSKMLPDIE